MPTKENKGVLPEYKAIETVLKGRPLTKLKVPSSGSIIHNLPSCSEKFILS